jgi:hypothetical protein
MPFCVPVVCAGRRTRLPLAAVVPSKVAPGLLMLTFAVAARRAVVRMTPVSNPSMYALAFVSAVVALVCAPVMVSTVTPLLVRPPVKSFGPVNVSLPALWAAALSSALASSAA